MRDTIAFDNSIESLQVALQTIRRFRFKQNGQAKTIMLQVSVYLVISCSKNPLVIPTTQFPKRFTQKTRKTLG